MSLALANGMLLLMVLIEISFLYFIRKEKILWKEVIFNLNSGHILMWVLRGLEVSAFYFVSSYWSFAFVEDWPFVWIWIFTFIIWDMCFYWLHRLHHKFKILWAVHVVHHEGEQYNLSLGIRNSWYSSITSFPFFAALAIIGVPVEVFIATSSIHYFVQFYNHNSVVKNSGILEKIMITPTHHRVHHGYNTEYLDKNFGGTFIIWDKLFGTFQSQISTVPISFGVKNYTRCYDVLWASNLPFIKLLGLNFNKKQHKKTSYSLPDFIIVSGGLLLFGLLLYYISIEEINSINYKLGLFTITFIGTIANGGMSESKTWGLILWFITILILSPLFIVIHSVSNPIILSLFALLFINGIFAFLKTKQYMIKNNFH